MLIPSVISSITFLVLAGLTGAELRLLLCLSADGFLQNSRDHTQTVKWTLKIVILKKHIYIFKETYSFTS